MELTISPGTAWETAVSALAAENMRRAAARGASKSAAAARSFAEDRLTPAFTAARQGHTVVWDPPGGLTSLQGRWTCTGRTCGAALLVGADGRIYGSASEPCKDRA